MGRKRSDDEDVKSFALPLLLLKNLFFPACGSGTRVRKRAVSQMPHSSGTWFFIRYLFCSFCCFVLLLFSLLSSSHHLLPAAHPSNDHDSCPLIPGEERELPSLMSHARCIIQSLLSFLFPFCSPSSPPFFPDQHILCLSPTFIKQTNDSARRMHESRTRVCKKGGSLQTSSLGSLSDTR